MWCDEPLTVIASAPSWQSPFDGTSEQLSPTTVKFCRITFDEWPSEMCPVIFAPGAPMMVLFEPTVSVPLRLPENWMTRAAVPAAAEFSALIVVTGIGGREPPPVVVVTDPTVHPMAAQPTSGSLVLAPPAPPVPEIPPAPGTLPFPSSPRPPVIPALPLLPATPAPPEPLAPPSPVAAAPRNARPRTHDGTKSFAERGVINGASGD